MLQMLDHLLRENDSAATGTQVLPCLTDDLASDINLLSTTIHAAGGAVLNTTRIRADNERPADRDDYRSPIAGRADGLAATALASALRYRRPGAELSVDIFAPKDGHVDARYLKDPATAPVPAPTSGDPLLALARALCSDRFNSQTGKLAVVIYDESELDADQRLAAWNVTAFIKTLTLGPRTVVLLAATGEIGAGRHIRHDTGFRYAQTKGAVVRRHPPEACRAVVSDISRSSSNYIGFFLGAGFSASSGLALGNMLRDEALAALNLSNGGASSTQLAEDWYRHIEQMGGLLESEVPLTPEQRVAGLTLERVLREEYRTFSPAPPPTLEKFKLQCDAALSHIGAAPSALGQIISSGQKTVVCTVNFDELVEVGARDLCEVFATDEDFARAPAHLKGYLAGTEPKVPLWKLHGTITNLKSCVASDDQTLLGLSNEKRSALNALIELTDSQRPAPWIYVGASMRDTDLNPLWGRPEFAQVVREYWAMPYITETVRDFVNQYRAEAWRQQRSSVNVDQRLITETADTFLKALASAITASRSGR